MLLKTTYKMKPPMSVRIKTGHTLAKDLVCSLHMRERSGGKVYDATCRKHDGIIQTGATWGIGKNGRCLVLNGTAGHVVVADHSDFTPILKPFSISARVLMVDATSFIIASKGVHGADGEWLLTAQAQDQVRFTVYDESVDNGYISRFGNSAITGFQNKWIDVVGTYDGGVLSSGLRIYVNATRFDDTDNTGAGTFVKVEALGADVHIGRHDAKYSEGSFENIAFYNRVLNQNDVTALHMANYRVFDQRPRLKRSGGRE